MTEGMKVSVQPKKQYAVADEHTTSEGYDSDGEVQTFDNVKNVREEQYRDKPEYNKSTDIYDYEYPKVTVEFTNGGEAIISHGLIDLDDTEPEITIRMIEKNSESLGYHQVTEFNCYGFWTNTFIDSFGKERTEYVLLMDNTDNGTVKRYMGCGRGMRVEYPNGSFEYHGKYERFSRRVKAENNHKKATSPPVKGENEFTVSTPQGETRAINAKRDMSGDNLTYRVIDSDGNSLEVDDINDVEGSLYTIVAKHPSTFGDGTTVTTVSRAIGVYTGVSQFDTKDNTYLYALGNPNAVGGPYKKPSEHRIANLDNIEELLIKLPDGTIQRPNLQSVMLI